MRKIIAILILGIQIALTLIVTFSIYMILALYDNDFGIDGLFGLFIIQPIFAVIFSILTIIICLIIGLPIRLNKKLKHWWTTNFYIAIVGMVCGLIFLLLAMLPEFRETVTIDLDGQKTIKQIPNSILTNIGWLMTAFSLLHLYPPARVTENVVSKLENRLKNPKKDN
jgi:hypothetical protein